MNIYVGNLPYRTSEDELRQMFEAYGQVASVTLIKDKETGQMRGFGFVEMPNQTEAQAAIQALNGKDFMNRALVVNPARPREERPGGREGGFSDRPRFGNDRGGSRGGGSGGGSRGGGKPDGGRRRNDW